ncbi:putative lipid II flippase FtsW [bioreactor metagenome]|uniref:Putative lipid II flippase FtsW n=1 Tax=bioreactor metagenome TaxID=1076179 RepID=A0A645HNK3_9ZZZZ
MAQTLINIGMCLGIMPVIGLTLPLFSYGGTSIAVTLASLGMTAGVRLRQTPSWLRNRELM